MSKTALVRKITEIRRAVDTLAWLVNRGPATDDTRIAEAMIDGMLWAIGEGGADANMVAEVLADIGKLQLELKSAKH